LADLFTRSIKEPLVATVSVTFKWLGIASDNRR
jgi:hypothetical protein